MLLKNSVKGQSLLGLVLLIGAAVLLIGLMLVLFTGSFTTAIYGYQGITIAEAAANSGIADALIRLDRNPAINGTYALTVGNLTTLVTITQGSPSANFISILSSAVSGLRTRTMNAVVGKNASTTQMTVISWQPVP